MQETLLNMSSYGNRYHDEIKSVRVFTESITTLGIMLGPDNLDNCRARLDGLSDKSFSERPFKSAR